MHKTIAGMFLICWALGLAAQVPQHGYFPQALCKQEGVKIVTVYETQIDNPSSQAGHANRIRLAREMMRQNFYDSDGLSYRSIKFQGGGKSITTEVLRTYNQQQRLGKEVQRHYNTNLSDSTKLIQSHQSLYAYTPAGPVLSVENALLSADTLIKLDSVAYQRDAGGRLNLEAVYSLKGLPTCILQKVYTYGKNYISTTSMVGELSLNRDEYELDDKGRVVKERNYGPGDDLPRLETVYVYDPRGWLEEIRYLPNWQHFAKDQTVVSCKNKYDDHGKLVEVQQDYGDGKRRMEFYDYTYWVEN